MENPHNLPVPNDEVERIRAMARDLAYGAIYKGWGPSLDYNTPEVRELLADKWKGDAPLYQLLYSFEYLEDNKFGGVSYMLTPKAYALLDQPEDLPTVFVAYGTQESSAFGLAIEYRLRSFGAPVFIDRSIPPGDEWDPHLSERIQQSKYFVCLLAPETLKRSEYVYKEIILAKGFNHTFIPVFHSNFNPEQHFYKHTAELKEWVIGRQAIKVLEENAKAYHSAVEELLNRLGILLTTGR